MSRYQAVYASMNPGGFIEWSSENDLSAMADALLWQHHYGRLVALSAVVFDRSLRPLEIGQ